MNQNAAVAFKCPVVALKNGACLELERQIGIVGKVRPIVVVLCICLISAEEELLFEFGPAT